MKNELPKLELGMIINAIQCATCKQMAALDPRTPILVRSKEELLAAALQIHASTGIVCGDPVLTVPYTPAFMDVRMFRVADDNANKKANGNGGGGSLLL